MHPDTRSCTQLTSCIWTNMLLRPTLFRDTAPLPVSYIGYRDYYSSTYINCTATAPARNKLSAMTAKTRAIPGLHRDHFQAKVPGHCPDAAPGNTTSLYCRAVMLKQTHELQTLHELAFLEIFYYLNF